MEGPTTRPALPWDVRLVAVLDLLIGLWAVIQMVLGLSDGKLRLDFTLLYLFVGWALLGRFRGARSQALWLTIVIPVGLIGSLMIFGVLIYAVTWFSGSPVTVHSSTTVAILELTGYCLFVVWQVFVLTRERTRALYEDHHFLDRLPPFRARDQTTSPSA